MVVLFSLLPYPSLTDETVHHRHSSNLPHAQSRSTAAGPFSSPLHGSNQQKPAAPLSPSPFHEQPQAAA